jgi:Domain of unknown function (DUF5130)
VASGSTAADRSGAEPASAAAVGAVPARAPGAAGSPVPHGSPGRVGDPAQTGSAVAIGTVGAVDRTAAVARQRPGPFTPRQLARLDEALTMSSRETGIDFSVYVGALEEPTRGHAERLHAGLGAKAPNAVLLAVSPGQRVLHIVTGAASSRRLPDRSAALAALSMQASFAGGDLVGGIVNGLRMLSDHAGHPDPHRRY